MTNEEIITQLKDIKCHCQEMYEAEIKNGDTSSNIWGKDVEALSMAIKKFESQRWIPCSERLPEEYIHVLCQFTLNGMGECYLAHGVFHVVGGLVMTCNEVIAWQPLPEPYKAESEE